MAVEPLTKLPAGSDPAPQAPSPEPVRSRRSLLGAGLAGLAGLVLGSLGRPPGADAAAGSSLILGASNSAGTSNTALTTTSTGSALKVTQSGSGYALDAYQSAGAGTGTAIHASGGQNNGIVTKTSGKDKYALDALQQASAGGNGAAISASGGKNNGIVATTASNSTFAIKAINTTAGTDFAAGAGIRALAGGGTDADIENQGIYPGAGEFCGPTGIVGVSNTTGYGVFGYAESGDGVWGKSGSSVGVYGSSDTNFGIYSDGDARVAGNLTATGYLSKGGGSFKIDHPLDPANKFLYHSFVESPDMKNVYDGVVTLDSAGEATVSLPDWFGALNRDFRYQLTAIGSAAPDLHVKSEVQDDAFSIAGGASGQKVSWQLTGIRKDAWANAHRIPVEEVKPTDERGLYVHPTENGQPAARGIDAVRNAAIKARMRK